ADGILGSNRSLRAALQGKGYPLHYREFPGGHDYAAWSCGVVVILAHAKRGSEWLEALGD
ncbi:hypothetical protein ACF0AS_32195, partial [Pseudomonas aeruginosa]|uniref:hypothetical protein n=1 Tax=Pseudomonas aeruginosa TaxID=287 RepID=UPI00371FCEA5